MENRCGRPQVRVAGVVPGDALPGAAGAVESTAPARFKKVKVVKLGDALVAEHIEIVQCWYETWCRSARTYPEIEEAALKDHLPVQLRLIGEQLKDLDRAVSPQMLWQVVERLDPEARVIQHMPIEEVVQEYGLVVEVIRRWIQARGLNVSFEEYSYLFQTLFELTAESVRRYSTYQAERVKQDRAHYLAGLAHQMRTPLSTLSMQLQMLGRDKQLGSAKVEQLQRNVKHLIFLMNGVMRLERFKPEELPVAVSGAADRSSAG